MTRIDFYVLPASAPQAREQLACRLADKAYQMGRQVYIHTESADHSQLMDKLLWTFRQNSFVPHAIAGDNSDHPPPVLIGHGEGPGACSDVLLNLSGEIPDSFSRYERVAELVDQHEENLRRCRERYKFYQDRGYELNTHKLNNI